MFALSLRRTRPRSFGLPAVAPPGGCSAFRRRAARRSLACVLLGALLPLTGCGARHAGQAPDAAPGATFRGPEYLYGTVGSLTRLKYARPLVVTGYGLVVGLDGTGSSEVPQELRGWLVNEMTKRGVGRASFADVLPLTPEQMLASPDTAVVRVLAFVPAGAVAGTRFDVLVEAADTRTTSLAGGRLWRSELSPGAATPGQYRAPIALAEGPIFVSPTDPAAETRFEIQNHRRRAVVVTGGVLTKSRPLELVLNQGSYSRAGALADRINERFPAAPGDPRATANALSPQVISLTVPAAYRDRPETFALLVQHLFTDRSPNAVPMEAQRLGERLIEDPGRAPSVTLAWEALGPAAGEVLRGFYPHPDVRVALAALRAGAALGDEAASPRLRDLTAHDDPAVRAQVADAFIGLPDSRYGAQALRTLLDDPVTEVRVAAYEAMVASGNVSTARLPAAGFAVQRVEISGEDGTLKMVIDTVPVRDPLVYVTQDLYPRLVIFGPDPGFPAPSAGAVWDGRLQVVRGTDAARPARMLYQRPEIEDGERVMKSSQHEFVPTLATLAYVLGHRWTGENDPQLGFDLTYGEVVDAVYRLAQDAGVDTPVQIDRGLFTRLLEGTRPDTPDERPETPAAATRVSDSG